jgi:hypothetical protein
MAALCLTTSAFGEPIHGPLVALGFTNTPIGEVTTLEVIQDGVLFVGQTEDGAGVSVQLGEADSGVFLFPLTGDLYEGDTMEGKAYGSVNGATNQFVSSVRGVHVGNSSVDVTVDFSALGATRLSIFAGSRLVRQISNAVAVIHVHGPGYGCRANPWWRLPNGEFGALIELNGTGSWNTLPALTEADEFTSSCLFVRPDDPTNSVQFVSRVDVTSVSLGSFCLTDARLGMFYQRHEALGQATLAPAGGRLVVGNLVSNLQDGVYVELPGVSSFDMDVLPIELTSTSSVALAIAAGLGTASINRSNGVTRIVAEMASSATTMVVRSGGAVVGSATISSNVAVVSLSGDPRVAGYGLTAKTMEALPGIAVRLDRATIFTGPGGESFEGDELTILASEPILYEGVVSFAILANDIPSFTITGERATAPPPPPILNLARSSTDVTLWWMDPNRAYSLEAAAKLSDAFLTVSNEIAFANNRCELSVSPSGTRFFRLRHHEPDDD